VAVGADVLRARRGIVIGTGTRPAIPSIAGLAGTPYWANHEAIETEEVPRSLVVLGGGAVGLDEHAHFLDTDADMLVAPGVWALV
jgi:pyruvate/2-oxoglutarate dehydrogenase complex dihydrolipoamide dehydrogenase (E3) component